MIKVLTPGLNPDDYIYKSCLQFGQAVSNKILEQVNKDLGFFERRIKYNDSRTVGSSRDLIRLVGVEKAREIYKRKVRNIVNNLEKGNFINRNDQKPEYKINPDFMVKSEGELPFN